MRVGEASLNRFLSKDFLSGLMFIGFGLSVLYFGQKLAVGTSVRMGPGYVPHMLSYILLALGGLICVIALYAGGETVEAPKWRPITMVTIGIVAFALLLESFGLFPALVALVIISSLGGDEFKLIEVIGNVIVLTILCVLVFKVGLGMNISVLQGVW
jgi:Tripartite tricarboxylate transporter TctB family